MAISMAPEMVTEAEACLERISRHGVSQHFLDSVLPVIEQVLTEVPPERRAELLRLIDETAARQAETEQILARAASDAERLGHARRRLHSRLNLMQGTVRHVRDTITGAALCLAYRRSTGSMPNES